MRYLINSLKILVAILAVTGCQNQIESKSEILYDEGATKTKKKDYPMGIEPTIFIYNCPITPSVYERDIKMPKIYRTNNLRRKTGYAYYAVGEFIRVSGVITDDKCAPISSAKIQIWQADAKGIYKSSTPSQNYLDDDKSYTAPGDRFEKKSENKGDINFSGSGSSTTDNLGRYTFFTIMPGDSDQKIHFKVSHKNFPQLNTAMYFSNKKSEESPLKPRYLGRMIDKESGKIENVYEFNITLAGENQHLKY